MIRKIFRNAFSLVLLASLAVTLLASCGGEGDAKLIRIGSFPNVTHVQALVARNMARHGQGWFEERLPGYRFEWYSYNAGPSAMEALFGRSLDVTYVGPSPAINAYAVSGGKDVRILAGAVNGGAALLVSPKSGIATPRDFAGRVVATPQLGNTQDVSCRAWLAAHGLRTTREGGGDCRVSPTPNAMQAQLMRQGEIDAAWTVEPWASRLEKEVGARVLVEDAGVVTTVLAGRTDWIRENPETAKRLVAAHRELTEWILAHPEEAQAMVAEELTEQTKTPVPVEAVRAAWKRITITNDVDREGISQFIRDARTAGFLSDVPPVDGLIDER